MNRIVLAAAVVLAVGVVGGALTPPRAAAAGCVNGAYRAGCAGPNGAVGVRKTPYGRPPYHAPYPYRPPVYAPRPVYPVYRPPVVVVPPPRPPVVVVPPPRPPVVVVVPPG